MMLLRQSEGENDHMQFAELLTLLKSAETVEQINIHREAIAEWLPCVRIMFDYDQKNSAHQYDLWMHCLHTVVGLPRNLEDDMLYLAALLHDIGKPDCQVAGKREGDTDMHYYGHPEHSFELVRDEIIPILLQKGVTLAEEEQRRLLYYVRHHDDRMSLRLYHVREHLNIPVSFQEFQKLMLLEVSDAIAHVQIPIVALRVEVCGKLAGAEGEELYQRILNGE
ncbi:MAG: HD domain-containing protein [Lachnospiraceae bacterium]|nr:HD domain-containing protein [Lachnospiraceae bacterium]